MTRPAYDLPAHNDGISQLDGGALIGAGYAYDEEAEEELLFLAFRLPSGEEHILRVAGDFRVKLWRDLV